MPWNCRGCGSNWDLKVTECMRCGMDKSYSVSEDEKPFPTCPDCGKDLTLQRKLFKFVKKGQDYTQQWRCPNKACL